jgi:hypothetical protein
MGSGALRQLGGVHSVVFTRTGFVVAFGSGFFFSATDLDYPAFADTLIG